MDNKLDRTYEELLTEALQYQHPSGRKVRNDKGKSHNYSANRTKETKPRVERIDKGKARPDTQVSKTKRAIYAIIKAKLYKKDQELINQGELPLLRGVDENGYYIVIPAAFETKANQYKQELSGRNINHTVRRVCVQKELDLERHRFNAWQEAATSQSWNEPSQYIPEIKQMLSVRYGILGKEADEAIAKRQIDNFTLFCEFYHLAPEDAAMWDYDTWRSMYSFCPAILLDDDFIFSLTLRPGSPEFHSEFAYHADKIMAQTEQALEQEKERRKRQFAEHWRSKK